MPDPDRLSATTLDNFFFCLRCLLWLQSSAIFGSKDFLMRGRPDRKNAVNDSLSQQWRNSSAGDIGASFAADTVFSGRQDKNVHGPDEASMRISAYTGARKWRRFLSGA